MAFGDPRDIGNTLFQQVTSQTNPAVASSSGIAVSVGDLIIAVFGENTSLTVGTVTDNLGNTYTAQNAGTDAGAATGRAYYSIATVGGTLTSVSATATASGDDAVAVAQAFEGPFAASPLDANPANVSNDTTSPYTCPSTGTLTQADELIIAWFVGTLARNVSATSPNLLAQSIVSTVPGTGGSVCVGLGYQVVSSTSAVAPEFTTSGSQTSTVLGTMSFKKGLSGGNMLLCF